MSLRWPRDTDQKPLIKRALRKDGMFFPLSINAHKSCRISRTFPPAVFQQLEPPFKTVKSLYYPTTLAQERNKFFEPSFIEQVAQQNDGHVPLDLNHQESWRSFTKEDAEFAVGFRDIVPHGFQKVQIADNALFGRPGWEKAVFDPDAPLGEFEGKDSPNKNEVEDREFLENNQELRFKWSGCAQLRGCLTRSKLYYCCVKQPANFADENEELHRWRDFHNRIECPGNDDMKISLGNLDLSEKTSTGHSLIHLYIVRNFSAGPINNLGIQAQEFIKTANTLSERSNSQMDQTPLGEMGVISPIAEWNMGLMQVSLSFFSNLFFFFESIRTYYTSFNLP